MQGLALWQRAVYRTGAAVVSTITSYRPIFRLTKLAFLRAKAIFIAQRLLLS